MPTVALQDKKSSLAIQLARGLDSRLSQVASPLCYEKMTLCIPFSLQYKYHLYSRNIKKLPKRILREKPERKTRLTYLQSLHSDSSNSSTLTISISQKFSHLTYIYEKAFWYFGKQLRRDQFTLVDAMGYSGIR